MREAPNEWTGRALVEHINKGPRKGCNGKYWPARPIGLFSIANRFKLAWAVFTGRADALFWEWGQSTGGEQ